MKVLLVGEWRYSIYEEALAEGFQANNIEVVPFKISQQIGKNLWGRIAYKFQFNLYIRKIKKGIVNAIVTHKPSVVFFYRPIFFTGSFARYLKSKFNVTVISYNNDNPFDDGKSKTLWRKYLSFIKEADINYFYRESNIERAKEIGVKNPLLLMSAFNKKEHYPVHKEKRNDVAFIGHFEPDGREEVLDFLFNNGINIQVYGHRWNEIASKSYIINTTLGGEDYNSEITNSSIVLVFLSGLNKDTYTRRCFEIPACKGFMLAPRTAKMQELYIEDEEIGMYDSKEELLSKINFYLTQEEKRLAMIEKAYEKVVNYHSNVSRAKQIIENIHHDTRH